jgi:hypothetical protein
MTIEFWLNSKGKYALRFGERNAPCVLLEQGPEKIEPQLTVGCWLVLLVAVWSAEDLKAVELVDSIAGTIPGDFSVGIRPFDKHEENYKWCPLIKEDTGSPIWLILKDGKKIAEAVGLQDQQGILGMINSCQ